MKSYKTNDFLGYLKKFNTQKIDSNKKFSIKDEDFIILIHDFYDYVNNHKGNFPSYGKIFKELKNKK